VKSAVMSITKNWKTTKATQLVSIMIPPVPTRSPKLTLASCDLDLWLLASELLWHLQSNDMCLPVLVKICQIFLEICHRRDFCYLFWLRLILNFEILITKLVVSCPCSVKSLCQFALLCDRLGRVFHTICLCR